MRHDFRAAARRRETRAMIRVKKNEPLRLPSRSATSPIRRPTMTKRWDLINLLIRKRGYKRYLEIGCFGDDCFREIQA